MATSQDRRGGGAPRGAGDGGEPDLPPLGAPTEAVDTDEAPSGSPRWVVTAAAGLVALGLGLGLGVLLGFLLEDGDDGAAAPSEVLDEETPAVTSGPPAGDGDDDVVPARCIDALELADDGLVLLDGALDSVGELDPGRLDTVVESAEELRPDLERAIEECRADL